MLIDSAFSSEAFTVSRGEKTRRMQEIDAKKAQDAAQARQSQGLPAQPTIIANPPPAPLPVIEKLAGVLKWICGEDTGLATSSKIRFKDFYKHVVSAAGQATISSACDGLWDSATPEDVTYKALRKLGMDRGGTARGPETLITWIKSETYGVLMPMGEIGAR
jgi:hypothetical protein